MKRHFELDNFQVCLDVPYIKIYKMAAGAHVGIAQIGVSSDSSQSQIRMAGFAPFPNHGPKLSRAKATLAVVIGNFYLLYSCFLALDLHDRPRNNGEQQLGAMGHLSSLFKNPFCPFSDNIFFRSALPDKGKNSFNNGAGTPLSMTGFSFVRHPAR